MNLIYLILSLRIFKGYIIFHNSYICYELYIVILVFYLKLYGLFAYLYINIHSLTDSNDIFTNISILTSIHYHVATL